MDCRAKVIATYGPSCATPERLRALIQTGVDVFRLNTAHLSRDRFEEVVSQIRAVAAQCGRAVGILLDLQGPKIRTGTLAQGPVTLEPGQSFSLRMEPVPGDARAVSVSYPGLVREVQPGDRILLDDGALELRVESVTPKTLHCQVIRGGILRDHRGLNLPGARLQQLEGFTPRDQEDLATGLEAGIDAVALSFVRTPGDVLRVRDFLGRRGMLIPAIAKIERPEGVENLERILRVADGIMVARGDLGVEMGPDRVPLIQKQIIRRCNETGTLVITATQMLESMIHHPVPTRAEASDVANAVLDGTDALMLSGETAVGAYPVEAVSIMRRIIRTTEAAQVREGWLPPRVRLETQDPARAIAHAVCTTAVDLGARAIVAFTRSGATALQISKFRPPVPILAATHDPAILPRLSLYWGVRGIHVPLTGDTDSMIRAMEKTLLEEGPFQKGDVVILTLGVPLGVVGSTNMLMVHRLGHLS